MKGIVNIETFSNVLELVRLRYKINRATRIENIFFFIAMIVSRKFN
ncbi:MAG: hypothetical protein ABFD02_04800 [Bacteroidales bacterium]